MLWQQKLISDQLTNAWTSEENMHAQFVTGHQAVIGHQQLSDAVELYCVFLHTRESRQFRWGKGHPSKSQITKK